MRWYLSRIPTMVDLGKWRLKVEGNVERPLQLSLDDLKRRFGKVTYTAVIQCSGNGRSFFNPRVPGGQWRNGAMGNVTWSGVRVRDILNLAGVKPGSVDVAFNGLDNPPLPKVPDFIKSLPLDKAREEDVIVVYEMNGRPLPMLNGFPARLVVPGWYATYWVKALSEIRVTDKPYQGFWMYPAYRLPANPCGCVEPGAHPKRTVPITRMNTRSLIIEPRDGGVFRAGDRVEIMGVAFSGGYSVKEVVVSTDGGRSWREARLGRDMGRYSWIQWFYTWRPRSPGRYTIMAQATNSIGESQPFEPLWNPSGYRWNVVERVEVKVQ